MAKERFTVTVASEPNSWTPDPEPYVAYSGDDVAVALAEIAYAIADGRKAKLVARKVKAQS